MSNQGEWVVVHTCSFLTNKQNITKPIPNFYNNDVKTLTEVVKLTLQNNVTGEVKSKYIENPMRSFYIAKPQFRDPNSPYYYNYKKENESLDNLDEYKCINKNLPTEIMKALGESTFGYRGLSLKQACNSPYVYGADIPQEVIFKHAINSKVTHGLSKINTGFLDLETSVLPTSKNKVIISSFIDNNYNLYITVLKDFLPKDWTEEDITSHVKERLKNVILDHGLKITIDYFKTETEVILHSLKQVHESNICMCGIWNIDFDIPRIIERLQFLGVDVNMAFNSPKTPKKYRFFQYLKDHAQVAHITDKWHVAVTGSNVFFYDSMCLYSRERKIKGRKKNYQLGYISSIETDLTKLSFGKEKGHYEMQNDPNNFPDYIAYGGLDPSLLRIMESKNNDTVALISGLNYSRVQDYARATVCLRDDLFAYYKKINRINGSVGTADAMMTKWDKYIPAVGGNVLDPSLCFGTGLKCLREAPTIVTNISRAVCDIDVSSMYPNLNITFNISKKTKLSTCIYIVDENKKNYDLVQFFSHIVSPHENAVRICNEYFNLPDYIQMENIVDSMLEKKID